MFKRLSQLRTAVSLLNPQEIRDRAERPVTIGLVATTPGAYASMESFFMPPAISESRRAEVMSTIHRAGDPGAPDRFDLVICEQGVPTPAHAFTFYREAPDATVMHILDSREELGLPLARNLYPFRKPVVQRIVQAVARENALFALATALPNIVPNLIELPWAIGEFASDTAFLTMNQVRMAFLVAAASDKALGYAEQKGELASIAAGAFGWRAIARELAGKIPMGGGLIPKGAIAFAGTYVVGVGLEKLYEVGYGHTRSERHDAYEAAYERGKTVVEGLVSSLKKA